MKIIYQCNFCGEKFQNDEKTARAHEANCDVKNYKVGDRVEVLYEFFDAGESRLLKGTITYVLRRDVECGVRLVVRMDEQWKDDDDYHDGYDMWIPNDGAPSISKNVLRLVR